MKRRSFIKGMAATGASSLVPAGALGTILSACSEPDRKEWDFDEVIDRSGTWSIKYGRAYETLLWRERYGKENLKYA